MEITGTILSIALKISSFAFKKLLNLIAGKRKSEKIDKAITDARKRASMMPTSKRLQTSLDNNHLVDELIIHCLKSDMTPKEITALFLYGDKNASFENESDCELLLELIRHISEIICETSNDRDTLALQATIRKESASIRESIRPTDDEMQFLEQVIFDVQSGQKTLEDLEQLNPRRTNSFATEYISAYVNACKGIRPSINSRFRLSDALAACLASVLFSSGFYEECINTLQSATSNTEYLQSCVKSTKDNLTVPEPPENERIQSNSPFFPFALCINAELVYKERAFPQACDSFRLCDESLNPVSRIHYEICMFWTYLLKCRGTVDFQTLAEYSSRIPAWISGSLTKELSEPLSIALTYLDEKSDSELEKYPGYMAIRPQLKAAFKAREVEAESNPSRILDICKWGIEQNEHPLAYASGKRLLEIDSRYAEQLKELFENAASKPLSDYLCFHFYISSIHPEISEQEFDSFLFYFENEPRYFIEKYSRFHKGQHPSECMETALSLMTASNNQPCIELADIWVPYLVLEEKDTEIGKLTTRFSAYMSGVLAEPLLSALQTYAVDDKVSDDIARSLAHSKGSDSRVFAAVSRYFFGRGNVSEAAHTAYRAFKLEANDTTAALSFQGFIQLSVPIPEDIVEYAKMHRSATMDILLSANENSAGNPAARDDYLTHAILLNESDSDNALKVFLGHYLGSRNDIEEPAGVLVGTTVFLSETSNNTPMAISFYENSRVLPKEGCVALGARHYSQSSSAFLRFKNKRIGESVDFSGSRYTIVSIKWTIDYFCQKGFELLVQSEGCIAITFDENSPQTIAEQLSEQLKKFESDKSAQSAYIDGCEVAGGRKVYFGIETGSMLYPIGELEFIFDVISTPALPFRRLAYDNITSLDTSRGFLLAYNAIVLMSQIDFLDTIIAPVANHSVITISTKNKLIADIKRIIKNLDESPGRLALIDDQPILFEKSSEEKESLYDRCAALQSFIEKLPCIEPEVGMVLKHSFPILDQNALIDIKTASSTGRILVTEDWLEAQLIDVTAEIKRCTLFTLMKSCAFGALTAIALSQHFEQWGAEPYIDSQVAREILEEADSLSKRSNSNADDSIN